MMIATTDTRESPPNPVLNTEIKSKIIRISSKNHSRIEIWLYKEHGNKIASVLGIHED